MESLSEYDRDTLNLWSRSYREMEPRMQRDVLVQAAIIAVLGGMRHITTIAALLKTYEREAAADSRLICSLLPGLARETIWRMREASCYLRWRELDSSDG